MCRGPSHVNAARSRLGLIAACSPGHVVSATRSPSGSVKAAPRHITPRGHLDRLHRASIVDPFISPRASRTWTTRNGTRTADNLHGREG